VRYNVLTMDKRDTRGIVGGVIFGIIWFIITRDPLQSMSTGIIFAIAWFAGSRLSLGRRQRKPTERR
jgi:hypothetical protein